MGLLSWLFGNRPESPSASSSTPVDGNETRSWKILADLPREQAVKKYPDFDVAYLRAAYPTGNSGDHASAKIAFLEQGVVRCTRKSLILGRLSAYWTWKGDAAKAVDFAVKSLLAATTIPPDSPGDLVGSLNLLAEVFKATGHSDVAEKMSSLNPGYDESEEMQEKTALIVKRLASPQYRDTISVAAKKLGAKQFRS